MSDDEDQLLRLYLSDVRAIPDIDRDTIAELLSRARDGDAAAEARVLEGLLEATAVPTRHLAPPTVRALDAVQEANVVLMRLARDDRVRAPVLAMPKAL